MTLKQHIKDLAESQKSLKQDRKTGTLPNELPRDSWGCLDVEALPDNIRAKLKKS